MSSPITGPIPPYSNPPINPQFFQPSVFDIASITFGLTTTVEATENMNYVVGQQVRFIIPPTWGARQLNQQTGYVLSLPSATEVVVSINSSVGYDSFTISTNYPQKSQIIAIGDVNSGIISNNGSVISTTNVPGSFINISPL